jgi:DNA repair protein RadD
MFELRDYQRDALDALVSSIESGCKAPLVCAPTGSGKSLLIAAITKWVLETYDSRVIIAVDVKELIVQNFETIVKYSPDIDVGVYSSGLKTKDINNDVLVVGIQSIFKRAKLFPTCKFIILDECHKLSPKSTTRYQRFIADLRRNNSDLVVIGFTATPFRLGQGMLTDGNSAIFEEIVYDISIQRLVDSGYLSPIVTKGGIGKIDLSNVRVSAGEYNSDDLEKASMDGYLTEAAVQEIIAYGKDRKAWLIFAAGVTHAKFISDIFRKYGINSHTVYGDMDSQTRSKVIQMFKAGKIPCVINVNLLTTGFDYPELDLIALLTATRSPNKYVQALGRGMRIANGKENCLVLDYGNNVLRLGPVDAINRIVREKSYSKGSGTLSNSPMKECPDKSCRLLVPAATKTCPSCGYVWDMDRMDDRLKTIQAYSGAVLASQDVPRWIPVSSAAYYKYNSTLKIPGAKQKADTLLVEFFTNTLTAPLRMWLAFDSGGFPHDRAVAYAELAGGSAKTTEDALKECDSWSIPTAIYITRSKLNPRYWSVHKWKWGEIGLQTLRNQQKFRPR